MFGKCHLFFGFKIKINVCSVRIFNDGFFCFWRPRDIFYPKKNIIAQKRQCAVWKEAVKFSVLRIVKFCAAKRVCRGRNHDVVGQLLDKGCLRGRRRQRGGLRRNKSCGWQLDCAGYNLSGLAPFSNYGKLAARELFLRLRCRRFWRFFCKKNTIHEVAEEDRDDDKKNGKDNSFLDRK